MGSRFNKINQGSAMWISQCCIGNLRNDILLHYRVNRTIYNSKRPMASPDRMIGIAKVVNT